jgi:hypothetical protein
MVRLRIALAAAALALCAAATPAARAAPTLATGIADDAAVARPDAPQTVAAWAALGIDDVRLFAQWGAVSPAAADTRIPAGFDPGNPASPGYNWSALDRAVALVRGAGMTVTLSVTGPGPLWATAQPGAFDPRLRPRPDLFGRFARAVALRYGDRVDRYVVWNEPNVPLWLKPQFACRGRSCTPASPHLYRRLARAAYPAIHAADAGSTVLLGALAPRGQNPRSVNATMRPLPFLRALGCVGVLRAPDEANPNGDEAALADLPRLERLLAAIQRAGRLRNPRGRTRRFDLWFTEYGYQTRPPDNVDGVSPARQRVWLQQAAYLAWRNPRVRGLTQYVWRDEPVVGRASGWQSGLLFRTNRAKPALRAFPQPFWADTTVARRAARLWGQVRPGGAHTVSVQRRAAGSSRWTTIRRLRTSGRGFFALRVAVTRRVDYRFAWQPDGRGALRTSDVRRVAPR